MISFLGGMLSCICKLLLAKTQWADVQGGPASQWADVKGQPTTAELSSEFIPAYTRQTDQDSPTSNSWRALVFLFRTLVCSKPTKQIFAACSASGTWATLALSSRIANEARSRCPSGWQCRRHPGAITVLRCTALRFSARRGASLPH